MNKPYRLASAYTVALGAASVASANPVPTGIVAVQLVSTQPAYINIAVAPTATATSTYLPANWPIIVLIRPGEKVAGLQAGTGGVLSITELTF